jgi:hypothetical protein
VKTLFFSFKVGRKLKILIGTCAIAQHVIYLPISFRPSLSPWESACNRLRGALSTTSSHRRSSPAIVQCRLERPHTPLEQCEIPPKPYPYPANTLFLGSPSVLHFSLTSFQNTKDQIRVRSRKHLVLPKPNHFLSTHFTAPANTATHFLSKKKKKKKKKPLVNPIGHSV